MLNETFFLSQVVDRAVKKLRADGVNIKAMSADISDVYYTKLYDKMRKRGSVPESFLQPIIERHPVFRHYLMGEDSLAEQETPVMESRTYPSIDKIDRRLDELMEETREYRRLLEQQMQANADLQREKEALTKELIDLLKKKAGIS